jgi:hypothetical protein
MDLSYVKLHAASNETMQRPLRSILSKLQANFQVYEDLRRTLYVCSSIRHSHVLYSSIITPFWQLCEPKKTSLDTGDSVSERRRDQRKHI